MAATAPSDSPPTYLNASPCIVDPHWSVPCPRRPAQHRRRQRCDGAQRDDGARGVEPSQQVNGVVALKVGMISALQTDIALSKSNTE